MMCAPGFHSWQLFVELFEDDGVPLSMRSHFARWSRRCRSCQREQVLTH